MLTCCDGGVAWCLCMLNGAAVTFVLPFSLWFCLVKPTSGSYSVVCHAITPRGGSLAGSLGVAAAGFWDEEACLATAVLLLSGRPLSVLA